MKTAAQLFYLAVFALITSSHAEDSKAVSRSQSPNPDVCAVRSSLLLPGMLV